MIVRNPFPQGEQANTMNLIQVALLTRSERIVRIVTAVALGIRRSVETGDVSEWDDEDGEGG
jgi:hypothetical protein